MRLTPSAATPLLRVIDSPAWCIFRDRRRRLCQRDNIRKRRFERFQLVLLKARAKIGFRFTETWCGDIDA
jgi:hypothetical protein